MSIWAIHRISTTTLPTSWSESRNEWDAALIADVVAGYMRCAEHDRDYADTLDRRHKVASELRTYKAAGVRVLNWLAQREHWE